MTPEHEPEINLRAAARRRERDFIALFNALWYRDFPYTKNRPLTRVRAMYTAHLNGVVKACADLMGFFVLYEEGTRTDIIIETARKHADKQHRWAHVEIEWRQPMKHKVNEIAKLAATADDADVSIFVGYSDLKRIDDNIDAIARQWPGKRPLLVFIITYKGQGRARALQTLVTYRLQSSAKRRLRAQYALPWHVPGTRWELTAGVSEPPAP
ncbi:hypothetical protein RHCH11_RHCH11_03669 [Beijerinckiaceae bacterium RH CH11]|nr:hypothetical protein [Beijerinckiaceae bacterium]VVB49256.1 hypothetical protein RHCH11_RHCH11_03669 [Beijerinckiaceae bacterium RH CH11]VVB49335.1 hypothetical protein RHAL8_03665 [Beijerinckiaceae bacterium RH AL8]